MDFLKSIGDYYLFSTDQICLSVGATNGRPRAFDERPYKTISNFLMRSPLLLTFFVQTILILREAV